ncbi:MAG: Rpn family recombination-promoting nuclease/putative transposase [Methylococcaceae bacterium]|nr:Rpn family recombination-promoting nuclease/putative transposase [Methylococcaceae bacterium]
MKTDTLFYRLFLQRPELIFELSNLPKPAHSVYRFQSVEVKQSAFRIDGVFVPEANCPE